MESDRLQDCATDNVRQFWWNQKVGSVPLKHQDGGMLKGYKNPIKIAPSGQSQNNLSIKINTDNNGYNTVLSRGGGMVGGKWRQLYLNNSFKKLKKYNINYNNLKDKIPLHPY